jgi:hypothetical protein
VQLNQLFPNGTINIDFRFATLIASADILSRRCYARLARRRVLNGTEDWNTLANRVIRQQEANTTIGVPSPTWPPCLNFVCAFCLQDLLLLGLPSIQGRTSLSATLQLAGSVDSPVSWQRFVFS